MCRTLALAVSGLTCAVVCGFVRCDAASGVQAQAPRIELVVRARSSAARRCFEVEALRQRIAHYGQDRLARARDLRLELEVDAPDGAQLLVYRGSELVSRRRFDNLPQTCMDRRDTVALSIALALDGVIRALMPDASAAPSPVESPGPVPAPDPTTFEPRESSSRRRDASDASTTERTPVERVVEPEPSAAKPGTPPEPPAESTTTEPEPAKAEGEADAAEPEAEPQAVESDEAAAAPSGGAGDAWKVKLHAGGRWLAHALPSPVWTGLLGAELWVERAAAVELSAIASTLGNSTLARGRVQTRLIGGEVLGCYAVEFDGFAAQGCGGALAAWCRARGRDYAVPFPAATLLWAAATARAALLWAPQEVVSLRLVIQGHVHLVRPELRVDGSAEQLEPFWLGGAVGLDLVVSFD